MEDFSKEEKTDILSSSSLADSVTSGPDDWHGSMMGPPKLDRDRCTIDGLAFIGLSLAQHQDGADTHQESVTRQLRFDFNEVQDRAYKYFVSTDDNGWLAGGGESGTSYKLAAPDSAHVEIMRVGTFEEGWGGLARQRITQALTDGTILIPHMEVCPTRVCLNSDRPPEVEVRFDPEPYLRPTPSGGGSRVDSGSGGGGGSRVDSGSGGDGGSRVDLGLNWQIKFTHNQLFALFPYPARFCPGAHHMTIVRKAAWRDLSTREAYLHHCDRVVAKWRQRGPVGLSAAGCPAEHAPPEAETVGPYGLYLFRDRNTILEYFPPNWPPPYDTPEKMQVILKVLQRTWDEESMSWK